MRAAFSPIQNPPPVPYFTDWHPLAPRLSTASYQGPRSSVYCTTGPPSPSPPHSAPSRDPLPLFSLYSVQNKPPASPSLPTFSRTGRRPPKQDAASPQLPGVVCSLPSARGHRLWPDCAPTLPPIPISSEHRLRAPLDQIWSVPCFPLLRTMLQDLCTHRWLPGEAHVAVQ
jgi:hypothetical protein